MLNLCFCFLLQTVVSTANAKLALFFDWLFYQPDKDNIMNIGNYNFFSTDYNVNIKYFWNRIAVECAFYGDVTVPICFLFCLEPAILLMHHSIRSHPTITSTLLDFLCRIIPNYSSLPDVQARQGVIKAFRHILSKKVVM